MRKVIVALVAVLLLVDAAQAAATWNSLWTNMLDRLKWYESRSGYPRERMRKYPISVAYADSALWQGLVDSSFVDTTGLVYRSGAQSIAGVKTFSSNAVFSSGIGVTGRTVVTGDITVSDSLIGAGTANFTGKITGGGGMAVTGRTAVTGVIAASDSVKGATADFSGKITGTNTMSITGAAVLTGGVTIGDGQALLKGVWADDGESVFVLIVGTESLALREWHPH